jgi:hypothetical protein
MSDPIPAIKVRSPVEDENAIPVFVTGPAHPGVTRITLVNREDYPDAMVVYFVSSGVAGARPVFLGFAHEE